MRREGLGPVGQRVGRAWRELVREGAAEEVRRRHRVAPVAGSAGVGGRVARRTVPDVGRVTSGQAPWPEAAWTGEEAEAGLGPAGVSHVGVAGRMGRDLESVRSDALPATRGTRPPDLARRRKMPHDLLAGSVVARKGRTLSPGVRDLAKEAHMAGPTGVPGYLKARERPGPEALLGLARHHAAGACADGDWRTHGGMPLVATCGPASDVPTNVCSVKLF